ncbi:STAS domain-containing protein [Thioalkalicoccus limnaeus]|uniref:STAS domain-containing protein n=1 Tax=Thioalkalicoccus limnaeus TaxID=120681 RepID=A0ABV4BEV2_9GAMM
MGQACVKRDDSGVARVEGDLDFVSVVPLVKLPDWLFTETKDPVIDLAGVEHANSAGVALLLEWMADARRDGRRLRFVNLPDSLRRLAALSHLEALLGIEDDSRR